MKNNSYVETLDLIWSNFLSLSLSEQVKVVSSLIQNEMFNFFYKLLMKDEIVAKKVFKKLAYSNKSYILGQLKNDKLVNTLFTILPRAIKFKLVRDNHSIQLLSVVELLVLIEKCVSKIPKRTPKFVQKIDGQCRMFARNREGWKAQYLVGKYQSAAEIWFLNSFLELTPEQKFLIFEKLPFIEYSKILLSFQLYICDTFDNTASTINRSTIKVCQHGAMDTDKFKQKEIDPKYLDWYIRECVYRSDLDQLTALVRINAEIESSDFWERVLSATFEQMSDKKIIFLINKCKAVEYFIPPTRLFYLKKGDLNENFKFLRDEFSEGKIELKYISTLNQLRLAATL